MIKQMAFPGVLALALAAGCAHRSNENKVVVSESSSPYVTTDSYNSSSTTYDAGYNSTYYGPYAHWAYWGDYDNTSKGSGARALMANPYAQNTGYYYSAPVGGAVAVTETDQNASKGAGARSLTGETPVVAENSITTTTTTSTTEDNTSQGEGARTLTSSTSSTSSLVPDDATFVREAGQAGLAEVRMGELAQQNAQDQQVKDFGQRLVNDHSKANEELSRIASQKNFQMPTAMSTKAQGMIDHLSSLKGADFDKATATHAVEAHQKAVRLFRGEAQSGQDSDLKAFAQKTLPTLEEHLRMAKDLNKSPKAQ